MRSLLITLGCTLLVITVYAFWDSSSRQGLGPLSDSTNRPNSGAPDEQPGDTRPPKGLDPDSFRMTAKSELPPAPIDDRIHGTVGEGMVELQQASQGFSIRDILSGRREAITAAIHKVRGRLTPEDVDYLVAKFNAINDVGFRYSMLWLFRYVQDDRVVEPVVQLLEQAPLQVISTLAAVATPHAVRTLAELAPGLKTPDLRAQAAQRIAKSAWKGAEGYLEGVWTDERISAGERMAALAAMGSQRASGVIPRLLKVALGEAAPVEGLGKDTERYGGADLRAAAVMATMHHGDEEAAQRLLEEADQRPHDPGFQSMVDRNLIGYSGPSLVDYITQRVRRKSHVAWGEAIYLSNNCKKDHLEELQTFLQMTTDSRIRGVLEAAIIRARGR